jgi:hypothetical protein
MVFRKLQSAKKGVLNAPALQIAQLVSISCISRKMGFVFRSARVKVQDIHAKNVLGTVSLATNLVSVPLARIISFSIPKVIAAKTLQETQKE